MRELTLREKVRKGVGEMRRGEATTMRGIALAEGVTKSPQLYSAINELVESGHLVREEVTAKNLNVMFVFRRTDLEVQLEFDGFGSKTGGEF